MHRLPEQSHGLAYRDCVTGATANDTFSAPVSKYRESSARVSPSDPSTSPRDEGEGVIVIVIERGDATHEAEGVQQSDPNSLMIAGQRRLGLFTRVRGVPLAG